MDWLDEILGEYAQRKAEEKRSEEVERKRRDEETTRKKRAATEALGRAHNKFQEVKKRLVDHKYLCEVSLASLTDSMTGQQVPSELTLLVKNVPLWGKETLSKLNASSLVLTVTSGSDDLSVTTKDERTQDEAPVIACMKIDMLTDALIETILKKFIKQIFSK